MRDIDFWVGLFAIIGLVTTVFAVVIGLNVLVSIADTKFHSIVRQEATAVLEYHLKSEKVN